MTIVSAVPPKHQRPAPATSEHAAGEIPSTAEAPEQWIPRLHHQLGRAAGPTTIAGPAGTPTQTPDAKLSGLHAPCDDYLWPTVSGNPSAPLFQIHPARRSFAYKIQPRDLLTMQTEVPQALAVHSWVSRLPETSCASRQANHWCATLRKPMLHRSRDR